MERNTTSASYTDNSRFDSCARKHIAEGKATSGAVCPRRLTEKPSGYDPLDARSSRAGDTAAVAEMAMQRLVVPPDAGSSPVSRLNIMN